MPTDGRAMETVCLVQTKLSVIHLLRIIHQLLGGLVDEAHYNWQYNNTTPHACLEDTYV